MSGATICGYEVHPAADLFPLIEGDEFDALVDDIAAHGQVHPIALDRDGRIVDGRNRARACEKLGLAPATVTHDGDALAYAVSCNLHRRNLTDAQRAMIVARLAKREPGYRNQPRHMTMVTPTLDEAADLLSVNKVQIGKAKRVLRDGIPELADLVADGKAPVTTAARVATELPHAEQAEFVAKVRDGADPVKVAPPDLAQKERRGTAPPPERPPAPTRFGGGRRKHLGQIEALLATLEGVAIAFEGLDSLDRSIDAEEAARLTSDLSKQIRSLNRINSLLKERTQP